MPQEEVRALYERLTRLLESPDDEPLRETLADEYEADIAEAFYLFNDEQRSRLIYAMPAAAAAQVVVMLDDAVRGDVVEELDGAKISEIVAELPPDDAADVVAELDDTQTAQVLEHIEAEQSQKIGELLVHEEDSAGGIMTPDVVRVPAAATVRDAIRAVRAASPDDDLSEVCVVDEAGRPVGTVPLRKLVTRRKDAPIRELMEPDPITVSVADDQEQVVRVMRKYDLYEVPVVDAEGRLVGRITHDDILDVADEEADEDAYRMAGTDAAELESSSVTRAALIRMVWLAPCIGIALCTGTVMAALNPHFSPIVYASLSFFVPMIAATSGNTGIQISTIIIRGFARGDLGLSRVGHALRRELRVALVLAPLCGLLSAALVTVFLPMMGRTGSTEPAAGRADGVGAAAAPSADPAQPSGVGVYRIAQSVGVGMFSAVMVAGTLGIALPFVFRRVGVDPAIASGPLVTAMNDVTSVTTYLLIATWIAM